MLQYHDPFVDGSISKCVLHWQPALGLASAGMWNVPADLR
jgi:hypothetical protein